MISLAPFGPVKLFSLPDVEMLDGTGAAPIAIGDRIQRVQSASLDIFDIFDNSFIPTHPIAYIPSDLEDSGMDPSVWRVLQEENLNFVRPEDVNPLLEHQQLERQQPKPFSRSPSPTRYRPTLDEFMHNMERHRDDYSGPLTVRTNGQNTGPKPKKDADLSAKGPFRCPFPDCWHICSKRTDMGRHLSSKEHREPSVPCPKNCGAMFTRDDSAKRHGRNCGFRKSKP
ncbi:hypothetical protein C0991_005697 [Blastosporella zonata]|nr:hypothetical protein C0991_005697 [Blastosporella zonata]